jgi:hypothetical protein
MQYITAKNLASNSFQRTYQVEQNEYFARNHLLLNTLEKAGGGGAQRTFLLRWVQEAVPSTCERVSSCNHPFPQEKRLNVLPHSTAWGECSKLTSE